MAAMSLSASQAGFAMRIYLYSESNRGNRQQSQKMMAAEHRNIATITAEEFFRMIAN